MRKIPYPKPNEILLEEFLKPMGISNYRLANDIGVTQIMAWTIIIRKHM
jgi:plasmid maintenance system antidote protein VapI